MAVTLDKNQGLFRNELIFAVDAKGINMDSVLINLFMLLSQGQRVRSKGKNDDKLDLEILKKYFKQMEEDKNNVEGFIENEDILETWIRCNLVNMVNRGSPDKEKISSLRPIHLEAYRLRNPKQARDYNTADQINIMLEADPALRKKLKKFLARNWDNDVRDILVDERLDIDSLGILKLIKTQSNPINTKDLEIPKISPLLPQQAILYCDDIRRLLVYENSIPRAILLEYFKILTAFHLSLYLQKLIRLLPKMVELGTTELEDNITVVVDMTNDMDSKVSRFAIADSEKMMNGIHDYVYATFQINAVLDKIPSKRIDSKDLKQAFEMLKNKEKLEPYFEAKWGTVQSRVSEEEEENWLKDFEQYEDTFYDKYVQLLMKFRGGYQLTYYVSFIDNIAMKNTESGCMIAGRSRKHPRRFTIGSKLLEALIQILLLESKEDQFITKAISIEELMEKLRDRYGLIINGLNEPIYQNTDIYTHLAFKENVEAFKERLRQIGFYTDMSDAYILQKIRPRYEINGF